MHIIGKTGYYGNEHSSINRVLQLSSRHWKIRFLFCNELDYLKRCFCSGEGGVLPLDSRCVYYSNCSLPSYPPTPPIPIVFYKPRVLQYVVLCCPYTCRLLNGQAHVFFSLLPVKSLVQCYFTLYAFMQVFLYKQ